MKELINCTEFFAISLVSKGRKIERGERTWTLDPNRIKHGLALPLFCYVNFDKLLNDSDLWLTELLC